MYYAIHSTKKIKNILYKTEYQQYNDIKNYCFFNKSCKNSKNDTIRQYIQGEHPELFGRCLLFSGE